jgi:hypothetical protein|nr:MAG TPA: hypothetical protein [Caudoviricetes sp.]DAW77452.1 MAG TPA: hypothetical protein [Caudoviricetes sp.]DAX57935.1 MAG TPA: hypothetical protein [Caudoviricetes sp.]
MYIVKRNIKRKQKRKDKLKIKALASVVIGLESPLFMFFLYFDYRL